MEKNQNPYLRGRGAQINPASPYEKMIRDSEPLDWSMHREDWESTDLKTEYLETHPKTILNKVESPDLPMEWSMNPYQGCEHGCVYCYARNTHPYWGHSAGLDFEQKILIKRDAPKLLEETLKRKTWKASTIMFAGNTDVYQPAERKFGITRACLEVFWKYRHPVGLITKNSLILRDMDLLKLLASENLVHVAISVTTLEDPLRQFLEPRTASVKQRLHTIETLHHNGIPVFVMMAPVIPGINEHEILSIAKKSAEIGASGIGYTMVRLNGDVALIFEDWLRKNMPDRAEKVLGKIRAVHGGQLSDHRAGLRMRGEGNIAQIIQDQFKLAKLRYFSDRNMPKMNYDLHEQYKSPQMRLF